ncbi:cdc42 effector protein 2 [Trichomycterus rosablanca]|uniref:cdc42 effector protein 2 n=1 Tax=Trichomycterus rosablanca TaxID=2290929 RepID=UPI002F35256A
MSSKAPIYLKRRSRKGKKEKLRDLLSSDMISPPLGDFRHTIHIGSGAGSDDLFGDLSFLQGKFHLLPGQQQGRHEAFQWNCAATETSPLLKNALSLPVIGGVQALTLPTSAPVASKTPAPAMSPPPKPPRLHLESHHESLPGSPQQQGHQDRKDRHEDVENRRNKVTEGDTDPPYLSHAGSLLSLHLDLGPSILEDVLEIMDTQMMGGIGGGFTNGRQEVYT